jgi:hypothetical protein
MRTITAELLSAALHAHWEAGYRAPTEAVSLLRQRVTGVSDEELAEALRRAIELDRTAARLAHEWFASRGQERVDDDELPTLCPGFLPQDYFEVWNNNLNWARK